MSFDDFLFDKNETDSAVNYIAIYKNVKEAVSNSKMIFLDNQELEDSIGYFIDENEPQKALEIIDYGLSLFPDNIEFLLLKAETYTDLTKYDKALELLNLVEYKEPYNAKVYLLKASVYDLLNEDNKVLKEYQRALSVDVNEPELIFEELGYYFLDKLNYTDAIINFQKSIEIDNDNFVVFDAMTDIYIDHIGTFDGLLFFEDFTNLHPDCFNAWYAAGRLFQAEKFYHKAVKAYEKVLQNDQYHFMSIENVIQCLKQTEDYNRIIKICLHYSKFMYPYFIYELAETYFDMENVEDSLKYYMQLYNENQNDAEAILGVAKCFAYQGFYQKSFHFIDIGINNIKDNSELLIFKGLLYKETGDFIKAIEVLENVLTFEFNNERIDIYLELADAYCKIEDFKSSIDVLLNGIDKNSNNANLMFFLASCYYNNNEKGKAYMFFEDAMIIDNNAYEIFYKNCILAQDDNFFTDIIKKNKDL